MSDGRGRALANVSSGVGDNLAMHSRRHTVWLFLIALMFVLVPIGTAPASGDQNNGPDSSSGACRALRLRLLLLALICCLLPAITARASGTDIDDRPIVVLRIDDCPTTWTIPYAGLGGVSALAYGKQKRIPITWAIIASQANTGASLTWAQLKDYLDTAGGEPASHSVVHAAMPSQQHYINELVQSKAMIQANLPGYQCDTFLQPGTWTNDAYIDTFAKLNNPIGLAIQANYSHSMAYLGFGWRTGNIYYHHCTTNAIGLDAPNNPSIPAVISMLDAAANTPGLILVISGHGVQEQGQSDTYRIRADVLRATMDKLAQLRDQGKIRLTGLSDAFSTSFSTDLNHVPDAGFEAANPSLITMPWQFGGAAQMVSPGGVNDSRFCLLPDTSSSASTTMLQIAPGRYEVSWYQKVAAGKQNAGLYATLSSMTQYSAGQRSDMDWALFTNTSPSQWEKKTALALVPDMLNCSQVLLRPAPSGGYCLDNVSIVSAPIDPAESASMVTVTPSPGVCTISWRNPTDPSLTTTTVRYNSRTHPLTTSTGSFLCTTSSVPGIGQHISIPFDWTSYSNAFFSVFSNKIGGGSAPPDLYAVKIDQTPPTLPGVSLTVDAEGTIHAEWTASDPDSQVVGYQYAVGSANGDSSIKQWIYTSNTNAAIAGLRYGSNVCVSVKAQNTYGFWSGSGSAQTYLQTGVGLASKHPDGDLITISGRVTAAFDGCAYVQAQDRSRGIRVEGSVSTLHEGDLVTVSGQLGTRNGERFIDTHVDQH